MTTRITTGQLFCLLSLFLMGSAWLFGLGSQAKQDAWLASLSGMAAGLPLIGLYLLLQRQFPQQTLVQYLPSILGKLLGKAIALAYIAYFLYTAARVTRDFADLIVIAMLPKTPMLMLILVLVGLAAYGVHHGPEVLARAAQVLYPLAAGLMFVATATALEDFSTDRLLPVLEQGWTGLWMATFPLTVTVPFGESILFGMLWPSVSQGRGKWSLAAAAGAGLYLSYLSLIVVGVMGAHLVDTSYFPLLQLVRQIRITEMVERLDAIAVLVLVLGGYMKISLFYFGATLGAAQWLGLIDYRPLVLPIGAVIAPLAVAIAGSFPEHLAIGLGTLPYVLHIPLQIVVPVLLLLILGLRTLVRRLAASTDGDGEY